MENIISTLPNQNLTNRKHGIGFGLLITFSLILHSLTLMRYPPPFVDEAWLASRGWSIIYNGINFSSLDAGVVDRFEGYWTFFPWLPSWLLSLSLRPYTSPELLPVRMVSLGFGLVLLIAVYKIGNRYGGYRTGFLSSLLLSLSIPFLISAHLGRPDVYVAALGYSAIALTLIEKHNRVWNHLIAGLLVGLAFEMHPNASIFIPVIITGYLLDSGSRIIRNRPFWAFCLGVSLGLVYYVWLHILPFPGTFVEINKVIFVTTHTPPIFSFREILSSIWIFSKNSFRYDPISIPIIFSAIFGVYVAKSRNKKHLYLSSLILIISFILLIQNKSIYYVILYAPFIYIVLADLLTTFLGKFRNRLDKYIRYTLVSTLFVTHMLMFAFVLTNYSQNEHDYQNVIAKIGEVVRPGDKLLANQIYWFGLHDHIFYSWEQLLYFNRIDRNASIHDGMRELGPDVFILDQWIEGSLSTTVPDSNYGQYYRLPRDQVYSFLADYGQLIKEFNDETYGLVKIYRLDWPD